MTSKSELPPLPPSYDEATASAVTSILPAERPVPAQLIRRKPVASAAGSSSRTATTYGFAKPHLDHDESGKAVEDIKCTNKDDVPTSSSVPPDSARPVSRQTILRQAAQYPTTSTITPITRPSSAKASSLSALKTGFEEARHFAGGLMYHPIEFSKHYSILRHSHGLVYYRGSATSITLSIFSDQTLAKTRMFWLQPKGWTGHTGLKVKALVRSTSDWINVTPVNQISAYQLSATDERAWQRDIKQFQRKAEGYTAKHKIRETVILRIPVDAQDGYWRILLCDEKKKILCPSPVFRLLSASSSPSSLRGASLGNLPLEIGASVLSQLGTAQVQGVISPITDSITNAMQSAMPYQPGVLAQEAGTMAVDEAYTRSGAQERVEAANAAYDAARDATYSPVSTDSSTVDSGPQPPYPITIASRIEPNIGRTSVDLGMPTVKLRSIPPDVSHKLSGYYFGWARLTTPQAQARPSKDSITWYPSVISILPDVHSASSVIANVLKTATVYLIHDIDTTNLVGASVEVRILGFIRPHTLAHASAETGYDEPSADDALLAFVQDVAFAQDILEREGWDADAGQNQSDIDWTDRYVASRTNLMKQIDRIPTTSMGIRTARDTLKDRAVGTGGVFVVRG